MAFQVTVFAVYGYEKFGIEKIVQYLVLFLAGVPRNVNFFQAFINDVRALFIKIVDDAVHHFFISGNGRRGNNNRIVVSDRHFVEIARSHTGKRAHRLALRTRRNDQKLAVEQVFTLFDIDQYTFGYLELAYFNGGIDDLEHAPSRQSHFTAILYRQIDNLLQAVHVGRECRDNQPTIHVLRK